MRILATAGGSEIVATKLPEQLSDGANALDWSPDGKWIVSALGNKVYKVAAESGASVDLVAELAGTVIGVCWTRAGIYFGAANAVFRIGETAGSKSVRIGALAGSLQDCSPDGACVYSLDTLPGGSYFVVTDARTGVEIRRTRLNTHMLVRSFSVHPSGERLSAYVQKFSSDLWMMEGFPRPAIGWRRLFQRWVEPVPNSGESETSTEVSP